MGNVVLSLLSLGAFRIVSYLSVSISSNEGCINRYLLQSLCAVILTIVSIVKPTDNTERRLYTFSKSSVSSIGILILLIISPLSILLSITNDVRPVDFIPHLIAQLIGAAPLNNGRSEACMLNAVIFGMFNISFERNL